MIKYSYFGCLTDFDLKYSISFYTKTIHFDF